MKVIAEVKRRSPSKGWLHEGLDVTALAHDYAEGGATAISVLTDAEHFAGSLEDLDAVARTVRLPLLRKDFTVSENDVLDAAEAGASAVLLIVAALSDDRTRRSSSTSLDDAGLDAIVEVHDHDEAQRSLDLGARIIGINQRNLRTFDVDRDNAARVIESLPTSIVTVCESGLEFARGRRARRRRRLRRGVGRRGLRDGRPTSPRPFARSPPCRLVSRD